jgi:hypothetical protein
MAGDAQDFRRREASRFLLPEPPRFDPLPNDNPRYPERELSDTPHHGESHRRFSADPEHRANNNISALEHAESSGYNEHRPANSLSYAFED